MLIRENELRLSEECQRQHLKYGQKEYSMISLSMQRKVAEEFGFDCVIGPQLLQAAETLTLSEEQRNEVRDISFYRKYNRMKDVPLNVGDLIPDLKRPLHRLDNNLSEVYLQDLLSRFPAQPTVIYAGSYS